MHVYKCVSGWTDTLEFRRMHAPRRGRRSSLGVERTVVVAFVEPRRRVCRSGAVYVACVASCVRFAVVGGVCR